MVHLYGVVHGSYWKDFLTGESGERQIYPTTELISDLSRFPKGTRMGLEFISKKDWGEINLHLNDLPFNPPDPRFNDQEYAVKPYYVNTANYYWNGLLSELINFGHDIVFLEDKNIWFKYNEEIIKHAENKARRRNLFVHEDGESNEHYNRKLISFNIEEYQEKISLRKIQVIERDNQLLKSIKDLKVDVAIVGIGHSDYWMANQQKIKSDFGLNFEGYSIEIIRRDHDFGRLTNYIENYFIKNAEPDPKRAFERESLERAVRLLDTKRLSDRKPNFVGTWDIHFPVKGYSEMFIERNGKNIHGKIVDCVGDADFEGEISNNEIKFVKKYNQNRCCEEAVSKEIVYKGVIRDGKVIGYFIVDGFGQPFYATQRLIRDFVDLGISWDYYRKKFKKNFKLLSERLFDDNPKTNV